jgi:hypothetical protein
MHYGFFADKEDKLALLGFIFSETDFRVFESHSTPDNALIEFKNAGEIESYFDLESGGKFAVCLKLWLPSHGENVVFRKIPLKPEHNGGATFRHAINGWGLISLDFGGRKTAFYIEVHLAAGMKRAHCNKPLMIRLD